jgi:phosphatidylinositol alpha 1,6-mannosyltransferase
MTTKDIETVPLSDLERVELGLNLAKQMDRPSNSDLRILIFTATYFVLDGVTLTIRRIESYLRSHGATVKILSTVPEDISADQIRDIIVVPGIKIPFAHAGSGYAFGAGLDQNTIREIERFAPTVIHFTVPDLVALDGIRWCQKNNIAYIATWHSNYCEYLKYYFLEWVLGPGLHRYLKGFYEQIPTVYVPTPYMLKKMQEEWGYGVATELKEWGRGVDMKMFTRDRRSEAFRQSKGILPHEVVILWVGRLVPEKRPEIWVSVVKRLQAEGLPVKGMVVGHGTFEATLSQLKNIVCCGWLSGVALAEAYASADILVFPSDVETFGNVTLEALASGVSCVVEEKCGGHLVEDRANGFTCRAGNYEDFYKNTKRIVEDPVLRAEMSKNASISALRFERHKIMQQMAENYKDAIVKHRDPSYTKSFLQSSPEAAGRNFLSLLCCNFIFIKTLAEPFLNSTKQVQNLVDNTSQCVHHSRVRLHACASTEYLSPDEEYYYERSRFEDERKGRVSAFSTYASAFFAKAINYAGIIFSCIIVFIFIYASFTL